VAHVHGHCIEQPASDTSSVRVPSYLDIPLALKKRLNNFNHLARAEASSGVELTSLDVHRLCFTRRVACAGICVRVRLAAAWLAVSLSSLLADVVAVVVQRRESGEVCAGFWDELTLALFWVKLLHTDNFSKRAVE
jgi:hypothetical protein